jgi:hypothetical protein
VRREFLCVPLAFLALGRVAEAQSAQPTPEDVVRDFFKAEDEGRWMDAAHSLDLTRFEPIRRSAVQGAKSMTSRQKINAQEVMRWDPDMPLAVAEYQAKKSNEGFQRVEFLSREFARVSSVDSLVALQIDEAAARWLEAKGSKWQNEMALRESKGRPEVDCPGVPDSMTHEIRTELATPVTTILGATAASDTVRYVVIGLTRFGGNSATPVDAPYPAISPKAITMRKLDGSWRIVPAPDMPNSDTFGGTTVVTIRCSMKKNAAPGTKKK